MTCVWNIPQDQRHCEFCNVQNCDLRTKPIVVDGILMSKDDGYIRVSPLHVRKLNNLNSGQHIKLFIS